MTYTPAERTKFINVGLQSLVPNEINKLKLEGNIVLNDFIFNAIDDFGVVWVVTDIEGWWNRAPAEVPNLERGYGDGSYDARGKYRARQITLSGSFLVTDPSQVEPARDRLTQSMDLVYKGAWLKTGTNPIRSSWVRTIGEVTFSTMNTRGRTEFSIDLRAPDPIKYEWNPAEPDGYNIQEVPVKSSIVPGSGSAVITNIGNYPVPMFLEITGPVESPATIYNRTTDELIIITQRIRGRAASQLINKQLSFDRETLKDVATITTVNEHNFSVEDLVLISNVGEEFDGERVITSVPTSTTFTFEGESSETSLIAHKKLENGVATLETTTDHNYQAGDEVFISGVDAVFDGGRVVASVPDPRSFTFDRTRIPPATVSGKILVSNIATISTAQPHEFIVGEEVTISGVDVNFNGSYIITDLPSPTEFSYAATRTNAREVIKSSMLDEIVTLTTQSDHGFVQNEAVNVSNVSLSLNGGFEITNIPTGDTFEYKRIRATEISVFFKSSASQVATIATREAHGFEVGETVKISGIGDAFYDGIRTILSVPSNNTLTFSSPGAPDELSTGVSSATIFSRSRAIFQRTLISNLVTITTKSTHGVFVGETVTITGLGSPFNGTYQVVSVPSANTFTYNKIAPNEPALEAPENEQYEPPPNSFVILSGDIPEETLSTPGVARVSGSLPFRSASGTATVSPDIERRPSAGVSVKPNDVRFTPGLVDATAVLDADILEIDTLNREVFFNGFVEGARGKIDVLADFIRLAPGENILEFEDQGAPEGEGSMRVFYRSGWLS